MAELKLTTVAAGEHQAVRFSPVVRKWRYKITTGSRCRGLLSQHMYTCPVNAAIAGERMLKKLKGE